MEDQSRMRRWAMAALAVVAAIAIGTVAYQAGVSQGIALQPPPAAASATAGGTQAVPPPYPYYYGYYRPWRFGPFGFLGPLVSILFFVIVFRFIFWGLFGWGWHRRRWYYDRYYDPDAPSRFDDWHRRAHERMRDDRAPAPPGA